MANVQKISHCIRREYIEGEHTHYKIARTHILLIFLIQTHSNLRWNITVIHKLVNFVWNKEEFPDQRKESIIVLVHVKDDKTDCNNYHGISLLSTSYNISSHILLSKLSPYMDETIGNHQCGVQRNR
jgi:hypothetical protein